MDDFEAAVMISLNPSGTDPQIIAKALEYTSLVRSSREGWKFCVEKLRAPYRAEVKFWCLSVLGECLSGAGQIYIQQLTPEERALFRHEISLYLVYVCEQEAASTAKSAGLVTPVYIRNKLAQIIAAFVWSDYPHEWPSAFGDILNFLEADVGARAARVDLFFRILRAIDEDVTSLQASQARSRDASLRVRNALRASNIEQLVTCWTAFLYAEPLYSPHAAWGLDSVRRYSEWIDISLVANERILTFIYKQLTQPLNPQDNVRASSAAALHGIISKRMDAAAKINLLHGIQTADLLRNLAIEAMNKEKGIQLPLESELGLRSATGEVAKLINYISAAALDYLKVNPNDPVSTELINLALPIAVSLLNCQEGNEDFVEEAITLVSSFVNICKKTKDDQSENVALQQILSVVYERLKFPEDYDPADEDDISGFLQLRRSLLPIFKNITLAAPKLALTLLQSDVLNSHTGERMPADVERVFKVMETVYEIAPEESVVVELVKSVLQTSPFRGSVLIRADSGHPPLAKHAGTLLTSLGADMGTLSSTPPPAMKRAQSREDRQNHHLVSAALMYFELATRAHRVLTANHSILAEVLSVFFGENGLRCTDTVVRSRCAHLLVKLVLPQRYVIASHFLDHLLNSLVPLLSIEESSYFSNDDECCLFEAAGLVLGVDGGNSNRLMYLSMLLNPLIENIRISKDASEVMLLRAMRALKAAGALSKGFTPGSLGSYSSASSPRKGESQLLQRDGSRMSTLSGVVTVGNGSMAPIATSSLDPAGLQSPSQPDQIGMNASVSVPNNSTSPMTPPGGRGGGNAGGVSADALADDAEAQKLLLSQILPVGIMQLWFRSLESVLSLLRNHPGNDEVAKHVLFFLRRMVETIGTESLPYLAEAIPRLFDMARTSTQVNDALLLVNQVIRKFSDRSIFCIDVNLNMIATRCFSFLPPVTISESQLMKSEDTREQYELLKTFLLFVQVILTHGLGSVLCKNPSNSVNVRKMIELVVQAGYGEFADSKQAFHVVRQCYGILGAFVDQLLGDGNVVGGNESGGMNGDMEKSGSDGGISLSSFFRGLIVEHGGMLCFRSAMRCAAVVSSGASIGASASQSTSASTPTSTSTSTVGIGSGMGIGIGLGGGGGGGASSSLINMSAGQGSDVCNQPTFIAVIRDNIVLQRSLLKHCGMAFVENVCRVVLGSIGCSTVVCEEYSMHLMCDDETELQRVFSELIRSRYR